MLLLLKMKLHYFALGAILNEVMKAVLYKIKFLFWFCVLLLLSACTLSNIGILFEDLRDIPEDTGGTHTAYVLDSTLSPYGYYSYVPGGYESSIQEYPLLVFLHGAGERGNSSTDPVNLDMVLANGPPRLIHDGTWEPYVPMLVVSPQCHDGSWNADKIHEFIGHIISQYRVRLSRIYITGLSMGGYGTFSYIGSYGDESYAAAAIPICGAGNTAQAANFINIPLWAFHGLDDTTVLPAGSINMINAINSLDPAVPAKLTLYPGVGHNSWSATYNGSGMGTESSDSDRFNESIYKWMLYYQK
jgi:predicted peptidase